MTARSSVPSSRHPAPSTPSRDSSRRTKRATTRSAATPTRPTTSRCPSLAVGDALAAQGGRAEGPRDHPEAPLHRGEPRQGARGEGHRPPVDVREHHRRDPRPRLRHQARPGARPELARLQRRPAARGALRRPRRLRLHGGARGRPRRDRPRRAEARGVAEGRSTSAPTPRSGLRNIVDNLGEIDARALNSTPIGDTATLRFGKYGPYLEVVDPDDAGRRAARVNIPEDLAPDELTPEKAQELIDAPVAGDRVLGENPDNGKLVVVKDGRFGPYVEETDPEDPTAVDEATGEVVEAPKKKPPPRQRGEEGCRAQAAHRVALQVDVGRHGRPRDRAAPARPAAHGRHRPGVGRADHRAERPVRSLPEEGHRLAHARCRAAALRHHARAGARGLRAAEVRRAARLERARGVRGRPGQRQADQLSDGRFGAVRHRRRDERDDPARRGRRWRSPSSAPCSCSPTSARRVRRPSARRRARRTTRKAPAKK